MRRGRKSMMFSTGSDNNLLLAAWTPVGISPVRRAAPETHLWCHADAEGREDGFPPLGDLALVGGVGQEELLQLLHGL